MKWLNDIISKNGSDKALHFLGGCLISDAVVLIATLFWWAEGYLVGSFIAMPIVYILSYIKEKWLDDAYDDKDIDAAMNGLVLSFAKNMVALVMFYFIKIFL